MNVQSYQMHNVLNVYSKQLSQNLNGGKSKKTSQKPQSDQVNLKPEGKRLATMERVSKDIFDKITRFGQLSERRRRFIEQAQRRAVQEAAAAKTGKTKFVFNVIDTINQKRTNTLSVEDSSFLIQRLDQLSKAAVGKKTESWI